MSLKESILAAKDLPTKAVEVPEWACTVHIRKLSGSERAEWRKHLHEYAAAQKTKPEELDEAPWLAVLLVHAICDENRSRVFGNDEVPLLLAKAPSVLRTIADQVTELNRIGPAAVESAAKN